MGDERKTTKDSTKATTDERKLSPEPPTSPMSTSSTATTLSAPSTASAMEWEDALDIDTALLLNELSMEKSEFVIKKINRIAKRSTSLPQTVAYAVKEIKREHWRSLSQSSPPSSLSMNDEASTTSTITTRSSSIRNSSHLSGIRKVIESSAAAVSSAVRNSSHTNNSGAAA